MKRWGGLKLSDNENNEMTWREIVVNNEKTKRYQSLHSANAGRADNFRDRGERILQENLRNVILRRIICYNIERVIDDSI